MGKCRIYIINRIDPPYTPKFQQAASGWLSEVVGRGLVVEGSALLMFVCWMSCGQLPKFFTAFHLLVVHGSSCGSEDESRCTLALCFTLQSLSFFLQSWASRTVTVHRSQLQALDQVALVPEVQTSSRKVSQSLSPRGFHRSKARLLSKASCPSGV